jgi:hypothetical protein
MILHVPIVIEKMEKEPENVLVVKELGRFMA